MDKEQLDEIFDNAVDELIGLTSKSYAEFVMTTAFHNVPINDLIIFKGKNRYISSLPIIEAIQKEINRLKESRKINRQILNPPLLKGNFF